MVGLCGRATLFWGLPATLQHPLYTGGQGLHTAGPGRCMGQISCVTEAGPLWDPGFTHTIAPGSTHQGCRNGCRALHWSRGHRCPGTVTPPSGLVSPDASSLRSHPGTHVPPAREWRSPPGPAAAHLCPIFSRRDPRQADAAAVSSMAGCLIVA